MHMKDYSQILTRVTSTPWMMHEPSLKMLLEIFDAHLTGNISTEEIQLRMKDINQRGAVVQPQRSGSVGVLDIAGPIFPRANLMTELSGATSVEQFQSEFRTMLADDGIGAIVLNVDSPGGLSAMIPEMMEEIHQGRDVKPIFAVANTLAASAAYGLATAASEFYASPSAQVGSVGTYLVHTDDIRQREMSGVDRTVIKAGRFKAMHLESLTPEMRDHLQEYVNDVDTHFLEGIAKGRNVSPDHVRQNYGEGGLVTLKKAVDQGMIDGVATFDQVVTKANEAISNNGGGAPRTSVPVSRQSYDADKEHSEPGTGQGGEPTPREPPEKDDKAIKGGWRRDPPPPAYEPEESIVNREWLEARAQSLGIEFSAETTDEALSQSVAEKMDEIVVPLAEATADAEQQRQFAEDYPEQASQLAELAERDRTSAALSFANGYSRFEGSNKGYSAVVQEKIVECHGKVAIRQMTHDDLKQLLDLTSKKEATVEFGEQGSSLTPAAEAVGVTRDFTKDRKQFAELVRTAMTDDGLSRNAAIEHVSKQHPELAQAYLTGHAQR